MDINITLPQDAWNVVLKYLGQAPYVEVAPLIAEIQRQAAPQTAPTQPPE